MELYLNIKNSYHIDMSFFVYKQNKLVRINKYDIININRLENSNHLKETIDE